MALKILFLCPSLEPGRDGVGDYTRRLADELQRCGHECVCVAANDRHIAKTAMPAIGEDEQLPAEPGTVRLASRESWGRRFAALRATVDRFVPDWVSLQYVPHGFQIKGLPIAFALRMANFGASLPGRPVHIMFHELWGRARVNASERLISFLQKQLVVYLNRQVQPQVVHVTNTLYQQRLQSCGIASGILPLFSNIPFVESRNPIHKDPNEWVFAIFGTLREGWEPERLLIRVESARQVAGIERCRFVSIGRLGEQGERIWEHMRECGSGGRFVFERLGELAPAEVSQALQGTDFGIAVSPLEIIGKSGAVAAMREHGLPIIVTRFAPGCHAEGSADAPDVILLDDHFQQNLTAAKRPARRDSLPEVAKLFLSSLSAAQ
jgi:hypothetical protein